MEATIPKKQGRSTFCEDDLVHGYFQTPLIPDNAQIHIYRVADAQEPTRALHGFKNSGIHMQVRATELLAQIKENILLQTDDYFLHSETFVERIDVEYQFLELCRTETIRAQPHQVRPN